MPTIPVFAFLDFSSPLSYVADAALRRLEAEGRVQTHLRALELHPAPEPLPPFGGAEWQAAQGLASAAGLPLRLPVHRPRTAKAHEAARLAAEHGLGAEMRAALFAGLFSDGLDIGRIDVLVQIGTQIGLDPSLAKVTLDVDRFSARVARESAEARRLAIDEVPALVVGGGAGAQLLRGPQSYPSLCAVLDAFPEG